MNVPVIQNDLQIGIYNGRIVLGVAKRPLAMFSPGEAIMLASLLLKHTSSLLADPDKKDSAEPVPDETLGTPGVPIGQSPESLS